MTGPTFAELRQALNLGPRRLRMLLALMELPEVEDQCWHGTVTFFVGQGSVKVDCHQGKREAPREIAA